MATEDNIDSPELQSLKINAAALQDSITKRDAVAGQSQDFRNVTDNERRSITEINARIAELTPKKESTSAS